MYLYLWMKALHVIFMVTWFAGLFYLPRLYVYHAMPEHKSSFELFKVMERRLYIIMTIGMSLTLVFGVIMLLQGDGILLESGWFHAKLLLLALLFVYHYACYKLMLTFRRDNNTRDSRWYRWFNEAPSLLLILIVVLAIVKPF